MNDADAAAGTWLRRFGPPGEGAMRLVCFPHAGGAASSYRSLARALGPEAEVLAVQYPGRQDRRHEPPVPRLDELADRITGVLAALDTPDAAPYALFGHSLGALVAYETARRLDRRGSTPHRLFVSARCAPTAGPGPTDGLDGDAALLAEVRRLGGGDALDDPEVQALALPALRADYAALKSYTWREGPALRCPVTVLTGTDDPLCTPEQALGWLRLAVVPGRSRVFGGGHFYLEDRATEVASAVLTDLGLRAPQAALSRATDT
ncbi:MULTISPECIES: thioesterase II family protein [Streptomyces]|uniref:Putative thioesterase n=1 Tax=Streptomyces rochei TaxID=1928 RepID=Q83X79_STRRO|nr:MULTISPECIES: alpha/beta fold hydrolase [Streptomyces]MBA9050692.1 surfactin synthase thioesterase subunit [Streptomyces murinus]BAC76483.1 putative thioesterase [Streptomyces rochei]